MDLLVGDKNWRLIGWLDFFAMAELWYREGAKNSGGKTAGLVPVR